jgi:hypothetical protein
MPWWAWLLLVSWVAVAGAVGVQLGRAMHVADDNDWVRRGRPERRMTERGRQARADVVERSPAKPPRR